MIQKNQKADFRQCFVKAEALAYTDLMLKTKDEGEKNVLKWYLNGVRAEMAKDPDPASLSP